MFCNSKHCSCPVVGASFRNGAVSQRVHLVLLGGGHLDCVATVASNQVPLIPVSSEGLSSCTVTAAKNVYMITIQSKSPTIQRMAAALYWPSTITNSLPRTHVPATTVKKPGPRAWSVMSALT